MCFFLVVAALIFAFQARNPKLLGDLWEMFCTAYLRVVHGFAHVWRLPQVPTEVRTCCAIWITSFMVIYHK